MNDYENLKKKYGERFAKLCRTLFPTILEKEGLLSEIIESKFAPSKFLFDDLVSQYRINEFENFILSDIKQQLPKKENEEKETPEVLMDRAGYKLIKCETNEDVLSFKKYYKPHEELCTFRDPYRINRHHIFFAVKKNVEDIKRENFKQPQRQDEYGTSVISLQFSKDDGYLSIKNRYNHTVANPDATFSNNLENIIPGLTKSFEQHYGIKSEKKTSNFELTNYVRAGDGKLYKYNYEINNIYYCPNNIIIQDGDVKHFDKNKYELVDYFLIDKENKKISLVGQILTERFDGYHQDIEKIEITKIGKNSDRQIKITQKNGNEVFITVDKHSRMIKYQNDGLKRINNFFLHFNIYLQEVYLKNLKIVGDYFMEENENLKVLHAPKLKEVGFSFLRRSEIEKLDLPSLECVGDSFIYVGSSLSKFSAPKLKKVGDNFLSESTELFELKLPELISIGENFMGENQALSVLEIPKVEKIGRCFLYSNLHLKSLNLPNLKEVDGYFMYYNEDLEILNLPNALKISGVFLPFNKKLHSLNIPKVEIIGNNVLNNNTALKEIDAPSLKEIGEKFLINNENLEKFDAPLLKSTGNYFLSINKNLKDINAPSLLEMGDNSLLSNKRLKFKVNRLIKKNQRKEQKQERQR